MVQRGSNYTSFGYGSHIELEIEARFHTKRAQRKQQASQYRVTLRKRFYAHELSEKATLLGTEKTYEAAIVVAGYSDELLVITATFEKSIMVRSLASEDQETGILIHRDMPIHPPILAAIGQY